MFWIILALIAAVCTSLTVIFAKIGIKDTNSNFATFYRTGIVILFSLMMCALAGSFGAFSTLTAKNFIFLGLSGIATGCSWLCYYKAIKLGDVNKVAPIDKSSFALSNLLFLAFFFDETTNGGDVLTICAMLLSVALTMTGTLLMISKRKDTEKIDEQTIGAENTLQGQTAVEAPKAKKAEKSEKRYVFYAIISAIFAATVPLFIKIGMQNVPSSLGTLLRTIIVFIFSFAICLGRKEWIGVRDISKKSWLFLTLSGVATGGAWLSEYAALGLEGVNPVAVNSAGKLSILLTMLFSFCVLKEKFTKRTLLGLFLLVAGIMVAIVFSL